MNLSKYRKTLVAVAGAVLGFVVLVIDSPAAEITSGEVKFGLVALAAVFGVYAVPNAKQPAE